MVGPITTFKEGLYSQRKRLLVSRRIKPLLAPKVNDGFAARAVTKVLELLHEKRQTF